MKLKNSKCFNNKRCNTNIYKNYFIVRTVHEWNQLEDSIVSATSIRQQRSLLALEFASRVTKYMCSQFPTSPLTLHQNWLQVNVLDTDTDKNKMG